MAPRTRAPAGMTLAGDRGLVRLGYRVLRIEAQLVLRDLSGALALIRVALPR